MSDVKLVKTLKPVMGGFFKAGKVCDQSLTSGRLYEIFYVGGGNLYDIQTESLKTKARLCDDETEFVVKNDKNGWRYMNLASDVDGVGGELYESHEQEPIVGGGNPYHKQLIMRMEETPQTALMHVDTDCDGDLWISEVDGDNTVVIPKCFLPELASMLTKLVVDREVQESGKETTNL